MKSSTVRTRFAARVTGARVTAALLLFALLAGTTPAAGQDRFGSAVAVTDDGSVVVVKPAFGRGPAALFVFERASDGTWEMTEELRSEGTAERGENFGASLATAAGGVLVASGDPGRRFGAYGFARDGSGGAWTPGPPVPLDATAGEGGAPEITLETVMQILQPPARVIAAEDDDVLVGIPQGAQGRPPVRSFRRAAGGWEDAGALEVGDLEGSDRYGAALALRDGVAAVGAPGHGEGGAVFIFTRAPDGGWGHATTLTHPELGPGAALGSALAFTPRGQLVAGAARADNASGAVLVFTPSSESPSASWSATRLSPAETARGQGFGASVAATGEEVWVGAPGADEARGRVDRFVLVASGDWRPAGSVPAPELETRSFFGSSVALGAVPGSPAVVGILGANGNQGAAAIYEPDGSGGWSGPTLVTAGTELEAVTGGEVRCEEDEAAAFACRDVDLQAFLPVTAIGGGPGERVSDAWGWTDPETGREYALVGRTGGAAFIDVTDAIRPVYLGYVPANPSGARDLKVYRDHLFFTGDGAGNHGLIVFDLTRLRDVSSPPVAFEADARFTGIASAHNLIIDTEAGFAYTVGTSGAGQTCGGGLVMIDIRDPLAPEFAGCFTDTEGLIYPGRTHDAQCVIYRGPDEDYRGRELCFASNETALRIVDVTDKQNPNPISAASYPGLAYVHQGWLTEDQRYFFLDDELDELVGTTDRTRTLVWDVTDLDDPVIVAEHLGPNRSTDHNLYIKGDRMYQANYQAGLRVVDIGDPERPREVGFFDTTPYGADPPGFNGAWTAYPFFESGNVLVTSMHEGVFLLKPRRQELVP